MKIELNNEKQKTATSKKIKRAVVLGVMFTMGVSAFAHGKGEGKIYERSAWKTSAVDDMCAILDYSAEIQKDGIITEEEKLKLQDMASQYDIDYGKGAAKFVINATDEYAKKTSAGIELSSQGEKGRFAIVQNSVRRAAETQKSMDSLSDSNKKITLADYEGFGR